MPAASPAVRVAQFDILRGVAIAAVVALHVSWFYTEHGDLGGAAGRALAFLYLLSGFGVPLFLAVSGAALGLRYSAPDGIAGHVRFLWRRASSLLPAYAFWSLVSAALFRPDVVSLRKALVVLARGTGDAQFYFVPLLFQLYLVWPLLRPLARLSAASPRNAWLVALAGMALSAAWWTMSGRGVAPEGFLLVPMFWVGYFVVGVAAAPHVQSLANAGRRGGVLAAAIVVTAAAAFAMNANFLSLIEPPYVSEAVLMSANIFQIPTAAYILSVMALLMLFASRISDRAIGAARLWTLLGTHSYGIFLVHLVVLRLVVYRWLPPESVVGDSLPMAVARTAVCWLACLTLSAGVVAGLSRYAWTRPLVSNRR